MNLYINKLANKYSGLLFILMVFIGNGNVLSAQGLGLRQTDQDFIHFGDEKLYSMDFEQAIIDYSMAIEINPRNAEAYMKRARVYASMNRNRESYQDITTALDINPLAELYVHPDHRRKILKFKKYKYVLRRDSLADEPFNKSMVLDDAYVKLLKNDLTVDEAFLCESAILAVLDKEYDAAQRFLDQWRAQNPTSEIYHDLMGLLLLVNDQATESLTHFTQAISINDDYVPAYYNRAMAYKSLGQLRLAEHDFLNALEINNDLAKIHFGKANLLNLQGDRKAAMTYLEKAMNNDPNYSEAIGNYSVLLKEEGLYDDAYLQIKQAMDGVDDKPENYYIRGSLAFIVGEYDQAKDDFRTYLKQYPEDQDAIFNLVITEMLDGQVELACRELGRMNRIDDERYIAIIQSNCY